MEGKCTYAAARNNERDDCLRDLLLFGSRLRRQLRIVLTVCWRFVLPLSCPSAGQQQSCRCSKFCPNRQVGPAVFIEIAGYDSTGLTTSSKEYRVVECSITAPQHDANRIELCDCGNVLMAVTIEVLRDKGPGTGTRKSRTRRSKRTIAIAECDQEMLRLGELANSKVRRAVFVEISQRKIFMVCTDFNALSRDHGAVAVPEKYAPPSVPMTVRHFRSAEIL